jgi:hypothetical protein
VFVLSSGNTAGSHFGDSLSGLVIGHVPGMFIRSPLAALAFAHYMQALGLWEALWNMSKGFIIAWSARALALHIVDHKVALD